MNEKLKEIIEKGSEISGSISGAAIGLIIAGPIGAIGGAAAGPILTSVFHKIGLEISEKFLGTREEIRVGATLALSADKLEKEIQKGKTLRMDNFYDSNNSGRSYAETLLEGTLLKARNEYEEKKIKYYSNFIANMNLDISISFEKGNTLLRILESLSYRQIVILAHLNNLEFLDTEKWIILFNSNKELGKYQDLHSEILNLYNSQLLQQVNGFSMGISKLKISPLGMVFFKLLELDDVEKEDQALVEKAIKEINYLKSKLA